jgi:hypothetical protein
MFDDISNETGEAGNNNGLNPPQSPSFSNVAPVRMSPEEGVNSLLPEPVKSEKEAGSNRAKIMILALVFVLLSGGGAYAYYFFNKTPSVLPNGMTESVKLKADSGTQDAIQSAACIQEGEFKNENKTSCCGGLKEDIPYKELKDGICVERAAQSVCIACGDGKCGSGESACNCPADCGEMNISDQTASATGTVQDIASTTEEATSTDYSASNSDEGAVNKELAEEQASTTGTVLKTEAAGNNDADMDGLSDTREAVYGTDPNNPDSDGDGYLDGAEVDKGYNPLGQGLIEKK